ncbi:MAG: ATP-dependent metallopeptidase FtsH/Yme1/Tma family protein, partial [Patescibacteria group bacterium]
MKLFSRNILIAIAIFLLLASFYPLALERLKEVEEISLSSLAEKIKSGQVKKIEVSGDTLAVFMLDDKELVSKKEIESGFTETLKNYGVSAEEFAKIDIAVKNLSGLAFWVGAILPFLAPFLLVILFFWMISRQVKQANVQAFTFGRSKARVIMPDNKKDRITFQ